MHEVRESFVIVKELKSKFLKDTQVFRSPEYENWFLESILFVYEFVHVCLYVYA
jgi:hypothetical protein